MVAQALLRNTIDAWVSPSRPSRFGDTRLSVHSTANAYMYLARPKLPTGSVVTSARLRVQPGGGDVGGSQSVLLYTLTSAFDPNALTWGAQPTIGSQIASLTRAWAGSVMEFTVTSEVQRILDGGAWFGWRFSSTKVDPSQFLYGGQSTSPVELVIEYTVPPQPPIDLYPSTNQAVGDPKPTLSWTTPGGRLATQVAVQVQVATNAAFTTGVYTSAEISSGSSSLDLDLATPAFTALTNGQSRYWRVKIKNDFGTWSPWSVGAQFTYASPHSVTITAPGATTSDPTPDVTWTYSGTQAAWQALVYEITVFQGQLVETLVHDSGVQNSTSTTFTVPEGVVAYDSTLRSYRVSVRVWEQGTLVSVTGSPTWFEDSQTWAWDPTGATPPVELQVNPWLAQRPGRVIRWRYTGAAAARFLILRTRQGVITPYYVNAAERREGVTDWYNWLDFPPGRSDVTYQVFTIMADGTMSAAAESPVEVIRVDYRMPWVMSIYDTTTRHFCLVNADVDPGLSEISDMVVPVAGAPYLAQWSLQKFQGHAEGLISGDAVPGILTSEDMKANFLWLRENPQVAFFFQDEAIQCFIYNTAYKPVGRADGGTDYLVSFDFVQE